MLLIRVQFWIWSKIVKLARNVLEALNMRRAKFKIELLGYESFEGFTKDEKWNGWNCPYFTFEPAQKILRTYNTLHSIIGQKNLAYYDAAADAFVFPSNDEEEPEIFAAITENGQKYYPVGAFCWIWEENIEM